MRNRRTNKAFPEMEFHTVMGGVCLKFPGNDAVRTDYDYYGVPLHFVALRCASCLWFVAHGGASLTLGMQRNEHTTCLRPILRNLFRRGKQFVNKVERLKPSESPATCRRFTERC